MECAMNLQVFRKDGKIRGLAMLRGTGTKVLEVSDDSRAEYWRICEHCTVREAVVFCCTHAKYVCGECLRWHGRTRKDGRFILGFACRAMSMSEARAEVERARDYVRDQMEVRAKAAGVEV